MLSSLLLKEWLKLKHYFIAALLLNCGICLKIFFDIRQQMHSEHAEMVWYQAIHIQTVLYQDIRYLPLVTGLVLAAAQFVPEMLGRRLRLSLHLPTSRVVMLFFSLLSGFLLYLMICGLDAALIYLTLKIYFPVEVAASSLPTMLPWMLAGLLAYFGGVTVLLEINWSRRIFLLLVFAVLIIMLFSGSGYGWFIPALPWLIVLVPLALLSVFESGRRFQERGV
ncbi:MAG: hypothetical protein JKY62_05495 [Desulfocapsa sp.]|nr:hypothetical protein [Desulfocapsa sp.]MBN4063930.1 hypothetical protein [bacterium AH-315-I07]